MPHLNSTNNANNYPHIPHSHSTIKTIIVLQFFNIIKKSIGLRLLRILKIILQFILLLPLTTLITTILQFLSLMLPTMLICLIFMLLKMPTIILQFYNISQKNIGVRLLRMLKLILHYFATSANNTDVTNPSMSSTNATNNADNYPSILQCQKEEQNKTLERQPSSKKFKELKK